jgi:hypothetical protein
VAGDEATISVLPQMAWLNSWDCRQPIPSNSVGSASNGGSTLLDANGLAFSARS